MLYSIVAALFVSMAPMTSFSSCGRMTRIMNPEITSEGFLLLYTSEAIKSEELKSFDYMLISSGKTIPLRVIEVINTSTSYRVVLKKDFFKKLEAGIYQFTATGKGKSLHVRRNEVKVIESEVEPSNVLIKIKHAGKRELRIEADVKIAFLKINIKGSTGKQFSTYTTMVDGDFLVGESDCSENFEFKPEEKYKITVQTVAPDGSLSKKSNEVIFVTPNH